MSDTDLLPTTGSGTGPDPRSDGGDPERPLAFDGISMAFPDGTQALADITFSVAQGEFVSVVGPSGCGKSTILKIAAGLLAPSSGTATAPSNLGYVFQDATLLPWRTVRRNVQLLAELHGMRAEERDRVAQETIDLVGLSDFESHHPRRLSGGMKMRVSLARSLVLAPTAFLFDEPFSALDEITRERLGEELLRLFETQRFAGLFITHSIQEAVFLSSRVLVMSAHPGRLIADVSVPFPYPRPPDLRFEPAFAELAGRISTTMRSGMR
jgi:NitT/TauT family transport system ATP-binding protein